MCIILKSVDIIDKTLNLRNNLKISFYYQQEFFFLKNKYILDRKKHSSIIFQHNIIDTDTSIVLLNKVEEAPPHKSLCSGYG